MGIFQKIADGLRRTRDSFFGGLQRIFNSFTKIDEELFEELEEQMIMSDIGVETSEEICDRLRKKIKERGITDPKAIMELIQEVIAEMMGDDTGLDLSVSPAVIMVIGVNGAGKTTTIGKLCHQFKNEGKKVLVAAADTFRAAAIDQLEVWTQRAGVDIVKHSEGSDPGAVVYDALEAAKARNCDVVIIDTAGRLHNKKNLMEELAKINRIIDNKAGECSREVLLVLDATTGQNAVSQAKLFSETAPITGIVLTKLDGTAKGGIVISIKNELGIPVKLIGVGEKIDDLQPFNSHMFVDALFDTQYRDIEEEETEEEIPENTEQPEEPETEVSEVEESETTEDMEEPENIPEKKKKGFFSGLFGSRDEEEETPEEEQQEIPEENNNDTEDSEDNGESVVIPEENQTTEEEIHADVEETAEIIEEVTEIIEEIPDVTENIEPVVENKIQEEEIQQPVENIPVQENYNIPAVQAEETEPQEEIPEAVENTEPEQPKEEPAQPEKKKKGFFSRLFGRKDK
ncbi:MAG: signal recognition particle-docking protein FtsY [Ruminococcus sp.]|nr:signal recognition particle-docking protein FtsY [Ruminococcus sp.]